ncbi:MAG: hypothetical protein IM550_20300 [Microcystis sp. M54BS1]|uniref:hypothetical protein n=1 Tax=unclassified Microcystis TaxID=2643300 RepID=UPI00257B7B20|nr:MULTISPECIES: hypothetical protein [unclassified Microcystis]MCA2541469.1 hypothetical protein [Microcystis sp. M54BS1]MCA2594917.1 hypothetical protein [Microcystis sp. M38BS1]MCA2611878.1 hypothetical protein [Microcystis sp. M27BS1]MCA2505414.1 hypothetical protein [Microcystis sp. M62BS1]MCA2509201.1 hypothetical protein [Microcystis sp. M60BS1]
MPRGVGLNWVYDEARLQGRLWTPILARPQLYVDSLAEGNILDSSGYLVIPNLGTVGSSFTRGANVATKQFIFPQNQLPCFHKDNSNASGYPLGISYSLQPASGFSAYFFGATAVGQYIVNLSQFNLANSMLLAANNTASFGIGLYDGSWRARSLSTQTSLDNRRVIMSQRKSSSSSSSFIDTYLSDYRAATVQQSIACNSFLASATTVGFLGYASGTSNTLCKCFAVLHFQRMLSDYEDNLILGWGAWQFGYQDLLPVTHPFAIRPPLIGD